LNIFLFTSHKATRRAVTENRPKSEATRDKSPQFLSAKPLPPQSQRALSISNVGLEARRVCQSARLLGWTTLFMSR
jgi:hypothetical protein